MKDEYSEAYIKRQHEGDPVIREMAATRKLERAVIDGAIAYRNEVEAHIGVTARELAPQYFEHDEGILSADLMDAVDALLSGREGK